MIEDLKEQSRRIGAVVMCQDCEFQEGAADYFDRDEKVDLEQESIEFSCPECECDTLEMTKVGATRTVVVNSLEELGRVGSL